MTWAAGRAGSPVTALTPALSRVREREQYPRRCAASRDGSQRSDASGTRTPTSPLWLRRGAEGSADQGQLLFERRVFWWTPPNLSTAGCPQRSAGSQTVGAISFSLVFLVRTRKSDSPPVDYRPAASTNVDNPPAKNNQNETTQLGCITQSLSRPAPALKTQRAEPSQQNNNSLPSTPTPTGPIP